MSRSEINIEYISLSKTLKRREKVCFLLSSIYESVTPDEILDLFSVGLDENDRSSMVC